MALETVDKFKKESSPPGIDKRTGSLLEPENKTRSPLSYNPLVRLSFSLIMGESDTNN